MKKVYLEDLECLSRLADSMPNTRFNVLGKIHALVALNMRYEKLMVNRHLDVHPYLSVQQIARDSIEQLEAWRDISFIEGSADLVHAQPRTMEQDHEALFQKLWVDFSETEYQERIDRYVYRLRINDLDRPWLNGKRCIDLGCGHGNFAIALAQQGASFVLGLDYGKGSIGYANRARDHLGIPADQVRFEVASVYQLPCPDGSFDFAIQNGVFHHLEDEDRAYQEAARVLKPGAWFWVYTTGAGGIAVDLWAASTHILRDVPEDIVIAELRHLNISTNKRYHLGDGLNATYRRATWKQMVERLAKYGFGNFRRLRGGFPTDFDLDVIESDRYGREKFGEGDLRILCQRL